VDIQAELDARGLNSLNQMAAEDLALLKRNFVADLRKRYPGWSEDYDQTDRGKSYRVVDQFRGALASSDLDDRVEWEGLAEYMELHDDIARELDARRETGGSPNLDVEANTDLKMLYDAVVGDILSRNLMFADIFYRYLDRHTISNGSNGSL
jgi:hypothetical protein